MVKSLLVYSGVSVSAPSGKVLLCGVELEVKEGGAAVFIGPSGAGKTTLLRSAAGLIPVDKGWKIEGGLKRFPGIRTGWLAQNPALQLFRNFVHEEFPGLDRGAVAIYLEKIGLAGLADKRCCVLSQGEKTMVVVARALYLKSSLLALDEAMVNLSPARRIWLKDKLRDFRDGGGAVLIAEHIPEALALAEEYYIVSGSEVRKTEEAGAVSFLNYQIPDREPCGTAAAKVEETLRIEGLRDQRIKKSRVAPLSFAFYGGEIVGLSGDNGSGKTTLLNIIAGMDSAEKGGVTWKGRKWHGLRSRSETAFYATHDPANQLFGETVRQELEFSAYRERRLDIKTVIRGLGLEGQEDTGVSSLSFGQQQRLVLAVGVMNKPGLLLLDEFTYGMDRENLLKTIVKLRELRDAGVTIILSSHDKTVLGCLADRVIDL